MDTAAGDAAELTKFCAELPELREQARQDGWSVELERMLAELRSGTRPVTSVLVAVRERLGMPTRPRGYVPVPGLEPAPPPPGSYACPGRRCTRAEDRRPGEPLPECAVFEEPLSFG
ncbi:hypothetical protein [Streptomyces sp. NPDC002671]